MLIFINLWRMLHHIFCIALQILIINIYHRFATIHKLIHNFGYLLNNKFPKNKLKLIINNLRPHCQCMINAK